MSTLHVGTGTHEADDAVEAGRAAAREAVAQLGGAAPSLVLLLASVRYPLPALLAAVRSVTGDAPLAGATTAGHFHRGRATAPGRGVAVLALAGGDVRFGVGSSGGIAEDARGAGSRLTREALDAARGDDAEHGALVLLSDGLVGDKGELLAGVTRVAGAGVPVVGGAAADDHTLTGTSVFHDDRVVAGGAVGVWVASPRPLLVTSGHGWRPGGPPMTVTRTGPGAILELDGRPAAQVWDEACARAGQARSAPWGYPTCALGVVQPDGSHLVRSTHPVQDHLALYAPLPPHSAVQLLVTDVATTLGVVEDVAGAAPRDAAVLLAFDCTSRQTLLGDDVPEAAARLQDAAGAARTFGFFTLGEFARTGSSGGVHNATLTALAL